MTRRSCGAGAIPAGCPRTPAAYHRLLAGPSWRWWRPLLSLLVLVSAVGVLVLVVLGLGTALDGVLTDQGGPVGRAVNDLTLATLVPAAMLATGVAYWRRPGWLSSVVGRLRWRWLVRCALVVSPVFMVYVGIGVLLEPPTSGRPAGWVTLLVLTLLLTPLQAAGEEYGFRGWLTQNVGSWLGRPGLGLVVATVVSASLFALAHRDLHPLVLLDLAVFGASASLVDWRSGGLEAGIAIHVVKNLTLGLTSALLGGYTTSFAERGTTGTWPGLLTTVLVQGVVVALLWWQARRTGVVRRSAGAAAPPALPDAIWIAPLGRQGWVGRLGVAPDARGRRRPPPEVEVVGGALPDSDG